MTISTNENTLNSYVADGVEDTFEIKFKWYDETDVVVSVDGSVVGAGYSIVVDNEAEPDNTNDGIVVSYVVFDTPPANTEVVLLTQSLALTQETDYQASGRFPSESHENALDKATIISREIDARLLALRGEYDALILE